MAFRVGACGLFLTIIAIAAPAQAGWFFHRCRPSWPTMPVVDVAAPISVAPEDAIKKVLDDQAAAWNKGDLETFMKGYWNSPELTFFSGANKAQGWQATLDRYNKRYRADGKEMGQLTFSEVKIEMLGPDSAFVRGRFELVMAKEKPTGQFTLIFKRMPDGWRIIHDHTSG
jgi:uncharacterized protein (TIGR02246 family)